MDRDTLEHYRFLKDELIRIKEEEMTLRLAILEDIFPNSSAGTFNEDFGPFKVKGVFKNTISIDSEGWLDYEDQMTDAERCCVKLKPSIILANYKKLELHEATGLLDDIVTTKPATPSIFVSVEEE